MATPQALANQENAEAAVSCGFLARNYPTLDGREDDAIRTLERLAHELIAFVPSAFRVAGHARIEALSRTIWAADAAADGYVLRVAGEAAASLANRDRHLALASAQAQKSGER